ncbi:MAG: hypothetical protein V3U76_15770 [Granulosicoccus sp.]
MIYLVSHPADLHATTVLGHLEKMGEPVRLLDMSEFPQQRKLTIAYENPSAPTLSLSNGSPESWDLGATTSVWWRRPQAFELPEMANSEIHSFTYNEWQEAVSGLWQLLPGLWINDPVRDQVAARKAYQLREAAIAGLRVPRTLITSDPDQARAFIKALGMDNTVYKVFSATQHSWRETRVLRQVELAFLDSLELAPVIFQECIHADIDLRITVIGDKVFPASIRSVEGTYKVDFRMEMDNASIEPVKLPKKIETRLLKLMRRLGLVYGAIDMRLTEEGEYVFLEINTAGQWLFVEYETEQPIARALAELLASPASSNIH